MREGRIDEGRKKKEEGNRKKNEMELGMLDEWDEEVEENA
jgi:hypothetical protein